VSGRHAFSDGVALGLPGSAALSTAESRPRAIRVAHIVPGLAIGGLEKMLVDFARRCDPARFHQSFIAVGENGPVGAELAALGMQVTALRKDAGFRPSMWFTLAGILRRDGVDVVHTHNNAGLFYGVLAARLAGSHRIIHTRHGVEPVSRKAMALLPFIAELTDHIVCVSRDNAELACREGMPVRRLVTLLNGVDVESFFPHGPCIDGPALVVARLSPEKDIATLIRAIAAAHAQGKAIRLDIAGDGTCREELRALATSLGLESAVRFLGQQQDVPGLLRAASLFVLPSITEGISLTLLEAMATGLPVVATAVGGNAEVILDGVTGRLVPPGDPQALARAMIDVLERPTESSAMGIMGRQRVVEHFNVRRTIGQYQELYAPSCPALKERAA
jgi:glycosyltransferase involved in cell wall biosynthesis